MRTLSMCHPDMVIATVEHQQKNPELPNFLVYFHQKSQENSGFCEVDLIL